MNESDENVEMAADERWLRGRLPERRPPADLESRILESLRSASTMRGRPAWPRVTRRLVVAAMLVGIGFGIGRWMPATGRPANSREPRFALLLYGPTATSLTGAQESADVAEHRAWAEGVAAGGHEISGEKLDSAGIILNGGEPAPKAGLTLQGYFVVSAPDERVATEIARSCPHARHGGTIVVRRIEPT